MGNVLLETSSMAFMLPIAQCDLKLSNGEKGVLSVVGVVGIILSSHIWGFLADTKGRKRVIAPTLLITFFLSVCSSFANSFWLMMVLRFFNGF